MQLSLSKLLLPSRDLWRGGAGDYQGEDYSSCPVSDGRIAYRKISEVHTLIVRPNNTGAVLSAFPPPKKAANFQGARSAGPVEADHAWHAIAERSPVSM